MSFTPTITYKPLATPPTAARFDVPPIHQGQIVEIAYGGAREHRELFNVGAPLKRVTDTSKTVDDPARVRYFLRVDRAVAQPCDEVDADGNDVRTWDVVRGGQCVASGFATRAEARREARTINAVQLAHAIVTGAKS